MSPPPPTHLLIHKARPGERDHRVDCRSCGSCACEDDRANHQRHDWSLRRLACRSGGNWSKLCRMSWNLVQACQHTNLCTCLSRRSRRAALPPACLRSARRPPPAVQGPSSGLSNKLSRIQASNSFIVQFASEHSRSHCSLAYRQAARTAAARTATMGTPASPLRSARAVSPRGRARTRLPGPRKPQTPQDSRALLQSRCPAATSTQHCVRCHFRTLPPTATSVESEP